MAEEGSAQNNESAQRRFVIQKIYVKDGSFESPSSPQVFQQKWEPDVNVQLGNTARILGNGLHEVVITVTVTAKLDGKTAYLAEVHQAGIFTIEGLSEQEMGPMVGSFCPTILFPYAREAISSLVQRGGFPQLILAPVNFDAIYAQHVSQMASPQAESAEASTH